MVVKDLYAGILMVIHVFLTFLVFFARILLGDAENFKQAHRNTAVSISSLSSVMLVTCVLRP